jgi:spore cortex formation protein SpoVR/YcgB (stage V sporulation)
MKLFRKKRQEIDQLEQRLDTISELTRGLGKKEFNSLIDAVRAIFEARQKLLNVQTEDEKENADIYEAERILAKESKK